MSNIRRLDDLEKAKIPEGYEEFSSTGASSSTIQLRPIQRDENNMLVRPDAAPVPAGPVNITLYTNGFMVNNGPFRSLEDEANQRFLEEIQNGDVPRELEKEFVGTDAAVTEKVSIKVNPKNEAYEPPTAPNAGYNFNTGRGQTLLTAPLERDVELSQVDGVAYVLPSGSTPVTIQLQLHNRQRVRLQVTNDTTIREIYQHVNSLARGGLEDGVNYTLAGGFPVKEYNDGSKTVGELKLANAALTQRKF